MTLQRPMFPPVAVNTLLSSQIGRRSLLCGLAAMVPAHVATTPAAPGPLFPVSAALNAGPDPIMAAIAAHRRAVAKIEACESFEQCLPVSNAADAAAWAMLEIEPTGIGGVAALLAYFAKFTVEVDAYFPELDRANWEDENAIPFAAALARRMAAAVCRIERAARTFKSATVADLSPAAPPMGGRDV